MSGGESPGPGPDLDLEFHLDAPPQKVWRAISIPAFREHWLPDEVLVEAEGTVVVPGEALRYRIRDDASPFLESSVTFTIAPGEGGGTRLRIHHERSDHRFAPMTKAAANNNDPPLMLAAA